MHQMSVLKVVNQTQHNYCVYQEVPHFEDLILRVFVFKIREAPNMLHEVRLLKIIHLRNISHSTTVNLNL